jgi:hypothetical protein
MVVDLLMHSKKERGDMFYDVEVGSLSCQIEIETREVLTAKRRLEIHTR